MGKMALQNITKGKVETPFCLCLYGPEGIGKSTFAAGAPNPVFLSERDGTAHLEVERFPLPETFEDVLEAVSTLLTEQHKFQTFVIDTADWLEAIVHDFVCRRDGETSIESYGYGKGYVAALEEWRALLSRLDQLRERKHMHIVVLAHAQVKTFHNPEGEDYERFELKLARQAAALLKEWPNAVLFSNYATYTRKDDKGRTRAVGDGSRVVYTEHRPAFDAKNRYGLPFELPLDWGEFERAARAGEPAARDDLNAQIATLLEAADDTVKAQVKDALVRAGNDARKLAQLVDWLRGKVQKAA